MIRILISCSTNMSPMIIQAIQVGEMFALDALDAHDVRDALGKSISSSSRARRGRTIGQSRSLPCVAGLEGAVELDKAEGSHGLLI